MGDTFQGHHPWYTKENYGHDFDYKVKFSEVELKLGLFKVHLIFVLSLIMLLTVTHFSPFKSFAYSSSINILLKSH